MNIAITVDPYIPVPPVHYGGIERVVDFLVRELVRRGHDVRLFAHRDSSTPAQLIPYGSPPHVGSIHRLRELWQVGARLFRTRSRLDVVHSFGRLAALLPILPLRTLPKIQSYQRAELPQRGIRRARRLAGDSLSFTACASHMYRNRGVGGNWTTIFNGVDLRKYELVADVPKDAPLMFLGRLERFKGAHHAIEIARAAGRRLVIAGNVVQAPDDASYFDEAIAPAIDDHQVRYVGPVDDGRKSALLGRSAALLMPIEWDEPFGIVMIEAMACGTPVIAFDRGSVPEIVQSGVNGFRCLDVTDAVSAVSRLGRIQRTEVRRDAERRFSASVIVDAYERLYATVADRQRTSELAVERG